MPAIKSFGILKIVIYIFLTLSFLGFLDALYLTTTHYAGVAPNCSILNGCDLVTSSAHATLGNIPLALIGAAYYGVVFLLFLDYFWRKKEISLKTAIWLTGAGFLVSLYLVYLQIYVIGALCLYCIASALTSTTLFFLGLGFLYGFLYPKFFRSTAKTPE